MRFPGNHMGHAYSWYEYPQAAQALRDDVMVLGPFVSAVSDNQKTKSLGALQAVKLIISMCL